MLFQAKDYLKQYFFTEILAITLKLVKLKNCTMFCAKFVFQFPYLQLSYKSYLELSGTSKIIKQAYNLIIFLNC